MENCNTLPLDITNSYFLDIDIIKDIIQSVLVKNRFVILTNVRYFKKLELYRNKSIFRQNNYNYKFL